MIEFRDDFPDENGCGNHVGRDQPGTEHLGPKDLPTGERGRIQTDPDVGFALDGDARCGRAGQGGEQEGSVPSEIGPQRA